MNLLCGQPTIELLKYESKKIRKLHTISVTLVFIYISKSLCCFEIRTLGEDFAKAREWCSQNYFKARLLTDTNEDEDMVKSKICLTTNEDDGQSF